MRPKLNKRVPKAAPHGLRLCGALVLVCVGKRGHRVVGGRAWQLMAHLPTTNRGMCRQTRKGDYTKQQLAATGVATHGLRVNTTGQDEHGMDKVVAGCGSPEIRTHTHRGQRWTGRPLFSH